MNALPRLIRLQKKKIDEQKMFVSQIRERIAILEAEMTKLEETLNQEQELATLSIEAALMFPTYAAGVKLRKKKVLRYYKEVQKQLEIEQNKLKDQFMELKQYEILEEARLRREKQARDQKIQNEQDDLVIVRYKRTEMGF